MRRLRNCGRGPGRVLLRRIQHFWHLADSYQQGFLQALPCFYETIFVRCRSTRPLNIQIRAAARRYPYPTMKDMQRLASDFPPRGPPPPPASHAAQPGIQRDGYLSMPGGVAEEGIPERGETGTALQRASSPQGPEENYGQDFES